MTPSDTTVRDWRISLAQLVRRGDSDTYPLLVFDAPRPSNLEWPTSLPPDPGLREFYQHCDGGYLAHIKFAALRDLADLSGRWVECLRDWDKRGDILDPRRHVVWAEDAGGCPLVVDVADRSVCTFQPDGGDWETRYGGVDAYLTWLFNESGPDDWREALAMVDR